MKEAVKANMKNLFNLDMSALWPNAYDSKYDFFHSVQRLEVYTLSPKVLVVHSEGKFILLQKASDDLDA